MKKKYIFFLVFTVLICSILIIGPYSIYNILPKSIKFALKEKIQKKYVNFDDSTKIENLLVNYRDVKIEFFRVNSS